MVSYLALNHLTELTKVLGLGTHTSEPRPSDGIFAALAAFVAVMHYFFDLTVKDRSAYL